MTQTTEQILRAQERQAEADRTRLLDRPVPRGLSPLRTLQEMLWGWHDTRQRTNPKWAGGRIIDDYSYGDLPLVASEFLEAAGELVMLGKRKTTGAAFDPILKFDARNGKITRCDRVQEKNGDWVALTCSGSTACI